MNSKKYNEYIARNSELRDILDDKRRDYFVEKVCSRANNDIIDNQHREIIYKELLRISNSPKVMQRATEMASELEFIFERARYNHHINQRDDETYVPFKTYYINSRFNLKKYSNIKLKY